MASGSNQWKKALSSKLTDPAQHTAILLIPRILYSVINPATGDKIATVLAGSSKDVDIAAEAARQAYKTSWGVNVPGEKRGAMLYKLASLMEQHAEELAALEALDVGS